MIDDGSGDIEYHCPINIKRLLVDFTMVKSKGCIVNPSIASTCVNTLISKCKLASFKNEDQNSVFADIGVKVFHMHLRLWLCSKKICQYWKLTE